jgi:hypothetical protein
VRPAGLPPSRPVAPALWVTRPAGFLRITSRMPRATWSPGTAGSRKWTAAGLPHTGNTQAYNISVAGGRDQLTPIPCRGPITTKRDRAQQFRQEFSGGRANVGFSPSSKMDVQANLGYVRSSTHLGADNGLSPFFKRILRAQAPLPGQPRASSRRRPKFPSALYDNSSAIKPLQRGNDVQPPPHPTGSPTGCDRRGLYVGRRPRLGALRDARPRPLPGRLRSAAGRIARRSGTTPSRPGTIPAPALQAESEAQLQLVDRRQLDQETAQDQRAGGDQLPGAGPREPSPSATTASPPAQTESSTRPWESGPSSNLAG